MLGGKLERRVEGGVESRVGSDCKLEGTTNILRREKSEGKLSGLVLCKVPY